MPTLERDGVKIYYEVYGEGPAILLSHGFSATSQMWRGQIEILSADHQLILWDMRGHGRSDAPLEGSAYSEAHTTKDMAALLDHLGVQTAVIGGLSLGGYMSLAFQVDHPSRTRALLIIDTGPGYKNAAARAKWNEHALSRAEVIERDGEAALKGGTAERSAAEHKDIRGVARAARGMLTQHSTRVIESLPDIDVPSLVVAGGDDHPFLAATDYMAAKIKGARKLIIPNAGHAVNIDQPEAFNHGVKAFLAEYHL